MTADSPNLQDILWSAAGPTFWHGLSIVATANAIFLFHTLHKSAQRNALTIARLMWLGGCILAIFIPWNSAFQIWSLAAIITAGAFMSLLIETRWCQRPGNALDKVRAIVGEVMGWHKKPERLGDD